MKKIKKVKKIQKKFSSFLFLFPPLGTVVLFVRVVLTTATPHIFAFHVFDEPFGIGYKL